MTKYELNKRDSTVIGETELYRIIALRDIPRHKVKKGDKGGYIASEANLSQEGDAWVRGNARVTGSAWVGGNALVGGDARVSGDAQVMGNALVEGSAQVEGNALVRGYARVDKPEDILYITGLCEYPVTITPQNIAVGCQLYTHAQALQLRWKDFAEKIDKAAFKHIKYNLNAYIKKQVY